MAVGGGALYHLSQKSIPKGVNPLHAVMLAYAVGIVLCAACGLLYRTEQSFLSSAREVGWPALGVGLGAVVIELGFLLAYRVGWNISVLGTFTSVAVALLLIPVGVAVFKEQLSAWNVLGILCCVAGLILISRK